MREIKFRAWDKIEKKMIYDIQREYDYSLYHEDAFGVYLGQDCGHGRTGSEDYEIMQYTGLHDKNGREIYEGDVVLKRFWNRPYSKSAKGKWIKCEVYWDCREAGFAHAYWNIKELEPLGNLRGYDGGPLFMVEAIGNIYENPELME